ncbi:MAG: hypothetical protein J0L93_03160 [Deltaproteobacteria bacterium]|nr:hypothetical protein [Deltaproteobacteria bacterium]
MKATFGKLFAVLGLSLLPNMVMADNWKANIDLNPYWNSNDEMQMHIDTYVPSKDYRNIRNQNSVVEVRFYVTPEGGQKKALFKENGKFTQHLYLEGTVDSVNLPNKLICPASGNYSLTVWLSVRHNSDAFDKDSNNNFKPIEEVIEYSCYDRTNSKRISFQNKESPTIERTTDKNGDASYNISLDFNRDQFKALKDLGSKYRLRLFVTRDEPRRGGGSVTVRSQVNRDYSIPASEKDTNANRNIPYKLSDACANAADVWDEIFGKKVDLSCDISVVKSNGQRDYRYKTYICPTVANVPCP